MRDLVRFFPGTEKWPKVYLKPGELHVAWQPTVISTLLGSCVAIVFFDPISKTTAVCHSVLPYILKGGQGDTFYYVDSSIEYMLDALRVSDTRSKNQLVVKIFGGADVIKSFRESRKKYASVGQQNVVAAEQVLAKYGLKVNSSSVRGLRGYKLLVRSDTGEVAVKFLTNTIDNS